MNDFYIIMMIIIKRNPKVIWEEAASLGRRSMFFGEKYKIVD